MSDRSRPTVPTTYRLVRDASGQTETLGVILLLGITVVGTVGIVALGSQALDDTDRHSQLQRTEHTMTLFDSRSAQVALGASDVKSVDLAGSGDGSYEVREGTGRLKIVHQNYTGSGHNETLYNATLGSVVYENDDVEIAYQGGGVWRKEGDNATMVSPPEFHYRESTLTLPVIRVTGDDGASGSATATIRRSADTRRIFPNATTDGSLTPNEEAPYDNSDDPYVNPIANGTVYVYVTSDYYQGWAHYFRARSDGNVTVYHHNNTVRAELVSKGTLGDFEMPAEGNSIDVRGAADAHSIDNFTVVLSPDDGDSADFSNLKWSLVVEEGSQQFEIHLRNSNSKNCPDSDPGHASATVYYTEDGGNTYQGWYEADAYEYECVDNDGDGTNDDIRLVANLTSLNADVTYQSLSNSDLQEYNPNGNLISTATWDEHSGSISWEPEDFSNPDTTTMHNVTNHYLAQFGDNYEIEIVDGNANTVNEDTSSGTLEMGGGQQIYITYLHVTENEVEVEL